MLRGRNPFIKEKVEKVKAPEKAKDVLEGLVEEVRAFCKEVAPIKKTYAERLKRGLLPSSSLPSLLSLSPTYSPSSKVTSGTSSFTSTRSKKKQL